jgi:hypothetical protein
LPSVRKGRAGLPSHPAPLAPVSGLTTYRWRLLALLAASWCLTTGAVIGGCHGLFTPAIPEPPNGKPIIVNYRSPEATLNTMELGIAAKGQGASAWLGAFADSSQPQDGPGYHQFFDPADLAFFEGACQCQAPRDWGISQEQTFYLSLLDVRPGDTYAAVFDSMDTLPDLPPNETNAILHRQYHVLANAPDGNSTIIIAIGFADLTFTKFSGDRWLITRWDDHVDPAVGVNPSDPYQLTLGRRRLESAR